MSNETYTESWLVGPRSTKFYTRTYLPPSQKEPHAAVVFLHGFAEHIGRYTKYHPFLAARGIALFTYDQRGYGLTALDTKGNKSKTSSYGKTSWEEQMGDIAWAIQHAKETFQGVPLFLMGHSMGGAEVLGFACQEHTSESVKYLRGVIATSPLIRQTHPTPKIERFGGAILSHVVPTLLVPAGVKAEALSHDPAVYEAYKSDPLVKMQGSLKCLHDMLSKGEWVLSSGFLQWPKEKPVLLIHGTADQVTDCEASKQFHNQLLEGVEKKISLFEGSYHELHNEPDGVMEKLAETIIAFVQEHASDKNGSSKLAATSVTEGPAETAVESAESSLKAKI